MERTIAIGDIHGCSNALAALIEAIRPNVDDEIVTLGDHIDRGPDTRGVLNQLLLLTEKCHLISLIGNHEEMLLNAMRDTTSISKWLTCGGAETLRSFGWAPGGPRSALADWFPDAHRRFFEHCRPYYETASHLFVHAGLVPELPMDEPPSLPLYWRVTDAQTACVHRSGKVAIVGHSPQASGEVLDLRFLVCIDTNCVRGGWLTALDVNCGRVWQADRDGKLRAGSGDCQRS
jgi:serine/threonine protein phosphatase 1